MYFYKGYLMIRLFEKDLIAWKAQAQHLPLLVRGARQVGKTFTIEQFGKKHFANMVSVNFEYQPELKICFNQLNPYEIIKQLSLFTRQSINPGQTLLFLDEIQECPQAIVALRYFKEQLPELHIISAGSLLEFTLNQPDFRMPVGRVDFLFVKPMTFQEFLIATGHGNLCDFLGTVSIKETISELIHQQLLKLLREYLLIGGMPAVIQNYIDSHNFLNCQNYQNMLLLGYRNDFGKYAKQTAITYMQELFAKIPGLAGQQFKYANVNPDVGSRELKLALQNLIDAGLVHKVLSTKASGLPLNTTANDKKFRLFFLDVGLVNRTANIDTHILQQENLLLLNKGSMIEQFVAQELFAHQPRQQLPELFFWARDKHNSSAEVDFISSIDSQIVPIEVKAGTIGKLKSLQLLMKENQLPVGIKISQQPFGFTHPILSIPLYMISELPRLIRQL